MKKEIVKTEDAPAPIGPYSQAILTNSLLFISGQIAIDPETGTMVQADIQTETHRVMKNLKAILTKAGCDFSSVIKTSIFLRDFNQFAAVNEVYGSYFEEDHPARETVEVSRLPKDANIEISMIAVKSFI